MKSSWIVIANLALILSLLVSGCGGRNIAPTATPDLARIAVPTFTPTTVMDQPATAPPTAEAQSEVAAASVAENTPIAETAPATPTPLPAPRLAVAGDVVNMRGGPGTDYAIVGSAGNGETFDIIARNEQGDWWQVCCVNGQPGWLFGQLATVENVDGVAVAADIPAPPQAPAAVEETVAEAPTAAPEVVVAPAPPYDPAASSAGNFDPNAQYQIVHFKVRGLGENNGGIRDSGSQHHIFLTVLDANGNGVDGAVVQNLVGEGGEFVMGNKGPGKTEITMFWEPFKLAVASDPAGPTTSQVSNQMGLAFPHLPDLVGKLGDVNYEYGACPTIDIKCEWPIQAIHYSYEITFRKVK